MAGGSTSDQSSGSTEKRNSLQYKKLMVKRANYVRALKHHEPMVYAMNDTSSKTAALARIPQIESSFEKFKEAHVKLEDHDEYDPDDFDTAYEEIVEIYIKMIGKLKDLTKEHNDLSQMLNSTISHRSSHEVKLPSLELPEFDGNYLEWTSFYDAFVSRVDSDINMANVDKMHFLKRCVKGTARSLINRLPTTNENYKIAWGLLLDRFNNKRVIVNACLNAIMNQPQMTKSNANSLRTAIDTTNESIQCIESLDIPIENWDAILVFIVQTKMDSLTKNAWEIYLNGSTEIPSLEKLIKFLETRHRILEASETSQTSQTNQTNQASQSSQPNIFHEHNVNKTQQKMNNCKICNQNHWMFFCPSFNDWSVIERKKYIIDNGLCPICFHDHKKEECRSKYRCKQCKGDHNTKIHESKSVQIHSIFNQNSPNKIIKAENRKNSKLLATAIVKVKDKNGASHLMRAFIDKGSDDSFISENAAQILGLQRKKECVSLTGLDNAPLGNAKGSMEIEVQSVINKNFKMSMDALIVSSIMQPRKIDSNNENNWPHLNKLTLADPEFLNPNKIDLLFGVDIDAIITIDGLRKGKTNEPIAQNSVLGWLVFGAISKKSNFGVRIHTTTQNEPISEQLRQFWESEEVELKPILSKEHEKCSEYLKNTIERLPDGKLITSIPFDMNTDDENFLGDSRKMALKRFFSLEQKFKRNELFRKRYFDDIASYIKLGHMSISTSALNEGYYLPHHAVVRESSITTKQRTVFDGSAKTSNGFSLNDRCLNGPTIQPELIDTFIRWRTHKVAIVADIEKMYRQILVAHKDRKFQKILWRFSEDDPIRTYELNTVTFGIKSAPFMAIFATFHLADLEKSQYPEASKRVKTDFYVDDCSSGSHSIESAKTLQKQFNLLFNSAHLPLRKWASSHEEALEGIPIENKACAPSIELTKHETIKTLGMSWTPKNDTLNFTIDLAKLSNANRITKRQLLSDASKLYDPCGLLSPMIIKTKILMQEIWKTGTNWDENVPEKIQAEWLQYKSELPSIESIRIKRWFQSQVNAKIALHGFCDSSERAYAAVIYLVQETNGVTTSTLVCSKTRVAPLTFKSIPRLELCGALLLAELMNKISKTLKIRKENIFLWTDSAIVAVWLNAHPSRWQTYVAHRVQAIQDRFSSSYWNHVRTNDNPADTASRGVFPSQLKENQLWFHGPAWLLQTKEHWPKIQLDLAANIRLEEKSHVNIISSPIQESEILLRFSNLTRLLRVTASMTRFIYQCRRNETLKYSMKNVTVLELRRAKMLWIRYTQSLYFAQEIKCIETKGCLNEKSKLQELNPQLNAHGILIVHGRLQHSNLPINSKFPAILPAKSHLSKLTIQNAHATTLHGTIHLTLARTRQEFWILNGRNMVKQAIHQCIRCYRQRPSPVEQLMAPLPNIKTTPSRAFLHCGLDFAGPIEIKMSDRRNATTVKGYICVFVCMASKATHLEVVGNLSTAKFIMSLRRFMARRGLCSDIYCDQGTNFVGASNELPRLFLQATSTVSNEIANTFAADGINFHFVPPSAPNWGGQWEAYVKLTKHHLRRINTSIKLTFEEMSTLLTQIEACINSRPLCAMTNDSDDLNPLTPGHLLIGAPLNLIPEPSLLSLKENTLDRFQAIQKGVQMFWKRFNIEYLHTLHPRKKWYKINENIKVNDLVVIIDDNMPPAKWMMARVITIHPGNDGLIRLVTLKTRTGSTQRPIAKICKLPVAPPEDVPART